MNKELSDEEALEIYKMLQGHYGSALANPINEPRRFAYQVKLYKYLQERKEG